MPIFTLKLVDKTEAASGTFIFKFEKPAGFNFKPGQYGGFTLINPAETDAGGITRRFSLLSTPEDATIEIATRIQNSAYKRVLKDMPIGCEIKFAGPTGIFTLHEEKEVPAVMIAGGIGIAPFYSIIRHAKATQSTQSITLFYGNQQADYAAFLPELELIEQQHPHFKLIATMDKPNPTWHGETGYISSNMIKKYVADIHAPIYYICGSSAMVTILQETLAEMGIDEARIRTEDFPGY